MKKEKRRQQILLNARDVFAKRGYHDATVDDIVDAAEIARGTFYLYYEDKRAVFEAIVDRLLARFAMTILRVDPKDAARSIEDQVRENIQRIVDILFDDRATTKILFRYALGLDAAFDRKILSFYDELAVLLEESLREGQSLGIVADGDARAFAYLSVGALKEIVFQVAVRDWDCPRDSIVDVTYKFLEGAYLRPNTTHARRKRR